LVVNDEAARLLRSAEIEMRRREMPIWILSSMAIASRCPSHHRSKPRDFGVKIEGHGSVSLRCNFCYLTTLDFLILLGLAGPASPDEAAAEVIDQRAGPTIDSEPIVLPQPDAPRALALSDEEILSILDDQRPIELHRPAAAIIHDLPVGYPRARGRWFNVAAQRRRD
jgi:hypothetical protein